MIFDLFLVGIGLSWLFAGSIFDLKTFEVPDWLSYSLMVVGIGLRLIYSLAIWNFSFILYGILGLVIMIGLGFAMYYGKQWGGGDCKLLMGVGALFGSSPSFLDLEWPFLLVLLLNILIVGGIYGMIWSLILMINNYKRFLVEFKKQRFLEVKLSLIAFIFIIAVSYYFEILIYGLLFGIILIFGIFMLIIIKTVEKVCMIRRIEVEKLTEGDWVAEDIKINDKVICSSKDLGLSLDQIAKLKKNNVKKILVKYGIPFVPAFFIAFVLTLLIGNLFLFLL